MNNLETLKSLLSGSNLLDFNRLEIDKIDEMLDSRDSSEFEAEWLRVFNDLKDKSFSTENLEAIETIREIAFKKAFAATNHSELAGYVADDFELIAKSLLTDYRDEWLHTLFLSYLRGLFPHINIKPIESGLELILQTASI